MEVQTVVILIGIGLLAGTASGFLGVGGGIVIVPALMYILGLNQKEAIGTSLFIISMPVAIMGLLNYAKGGHVQWHYGIIIASTFIVAGFFGSKLALKMNPAIIKLIFGAVMIYVALTMIRSGISQLKH
jgi:uncharacterized membrane protein YfcA